MRVQSSVGETLRECAPCYPAQCAENHTVLIRDYIIVKILCPSKAPTSRPTSRLRFCDNASTSQSYDTLFLYPEPIFAPQTEIMDPMEAMSSGGPVPKNFDADTADNNEDVRTPPPVHDHEQPANNLSQ